MKRNITADLDTNFQHNTLAFTWHRSEGCIRHRHGGLNRVGKGPGGSGVRVGRRLARRRLASSLHIGGWGPCRWLVLTGGPGRLRRLAVVGGRCGRRVNWHTRKTGGEILQQTGRTGLELVPICEGFDTTDRKWWGKLVFGLDLETIHLFLVFFAGTFNYDHEKKPSQKMQFRFFFLINKPRFPSFSSSSFSVRRAKQKSDTLFWNKERLLKVWGLANRHV